MTVGADGYVLLDAVHATDAPHCTRSPTNPRHLTFRPHRQYETQRQLLTGQATPAWQERYVQHSGIEGTIAQAARRSDLHQAGLIAIHALRNVELIKLRLHDLDLARGRLTVHRGTSRHTVYLDGLTHRLAVAWLRERQRRWPYTSNSYLLVSQQTSPPHYAATPATHADPSPPSGSASDETDIT